MEDFLKYDPNQPRDRNGRWTSGSLGGSGSLGQSVQLSPDDIAAMRMSAITGPHILADGTFTPERQALHDAIVDEFVRDIPASDNPTMFMNGGGPGSGKSSLQKGANADLVGYPATRGVDDLTGAIDYTKPAGAVLIDPDAVKAQLPEVKRFRAIQQTAMSQGLKVPDHAAGWAGASHEESSYLSKRIFQAAMDRKTNIVYDGTGDGGVKSVVKKVSKAREAGYRVEANYLYLDPREGLGRALQRGQRSGRNVPVSALAHIYSDLPGTFDSVKDGVFDKVRLFDNNASTGKPGTPAKLIGETGPGGSFVIHDRGAWEGFQNSGERVY